MMVGTEIRQVKAAAARQITVPRLVVNNLSLAPDDPHGVRLQNISLELRGGEILGIAGVAGNGQDEFFSALSGERRSNGPGTIVIEGIAAGHLSITQRRKLGAAFVPEERLGHGTAPRMKLSENALLTGHAASGMVKFGFVDTPATLSAVDRATKTFDVRKAKRDPEAASLSGGNLQKFVVGREILRNPAVLVVSQPTWGVDAGAAAVIRQALLDRVRRRRARHQPGSRRTRRNRRPDRRDVSRATVAGLADRGSHAGETRIADGRKRPRAYGGGACAWCLKSAPSGRTRLR
jgi:simple sugar transport system ATP-binding protein